jgi:uncharacterized protein YwqG
MRLLVTQPTAGLSRLGGMPRLPARVEWPRRGSGPLALMAEIALDEMAAASAAVPAWLPRTGSLAFFYDYDDMPWGDDPADADGAFVLFSPQPLSSRTPEVEPPYDLPPDLILPPTPVQLVADLGAVSGESEPLHRMLGSPDAIQDELDDPGSELLLQLDTDERAGLEFGDDGRLFFMVPSEGDLAERLARASAVLQEG